MRESTVRLRIVIRVVVDNDAAAGNYQNIRDLDQEAGDVDSELAGNAEGIEDVAALGDGRDGLHDVHINVEGADQARDLSGDTTATLVAAEAQARSVDTDRDRQHELTVIESCLSQAD